MSRKCRIIYQRPKHTLRIQDSRIVTCSLKHYIYSNPFPFGSQMERIINFRSRRTITDSCFIIGINDSVSIHIFIFYVSRHYRTKVLRKAVCYIFFIFEETFSYHSIYLSQPISCLHKILIQTRFFQLFLNFILIPSKITAKVEHYIS